MNSEKEYEWTRIHTLKCDTDSYQLVISGAKPFELRKNDRLFQRGDRVNLIEMNRDGTATGFTSSLEITCVISGPWLQPDCVALGLRATEFRLDPEPEICLVERGPDPAKKPEEELEIPPDPDWF